MRREALLGRIFRFGVVGVSGFVIDFSITALLYSVVGMYVATGVGFTLAATSNYFFNRRWTWRSTDPNIKSQFIKFYVVSVVGLGLHYLVLTGCMTQPWIAFSFLGFFINNDWSSKLVATAVVMFWNFGVNNFYTFKKRV